MKKELENATPEPREPAAREWLIQRGTFTPFDPNATYAMFGFQITELMEAYSAELRAQLADEHKADIEINEMMGRYMADAEAFKARAEAAEASLLQAQDLWDEIAVELDSAGIPASEPAPEGGLNFIATSNRVKMLIEKLASTSAPEGTV